MLDKKKALSRKLRKASQKKPVAGTSKSTPELPQLEQSHSFSAEEVLNLQSPLKNSRGTLLEQFKGVTGLGGLSALDLESFRLKKKRINTLAGHDLVSTQKLVDANARFQLILNPGEYEKDKLDGQGGSTVDENNEEGEGKENAEEDDTVHTVSRENAEDDETPDERKENEHQEEEHRGYDEYKASLSESEFAAKMEAALNNAQKLDSEETQTKEAEADT